MMMIMAARRLFQTRRGRLDTTSTSEDTRGDGSGQVAEQLPRPLPFRGWLQRRRNEGTVSQGIVIHTGPLQKISSVLHPVKQTSRSTFLHISSQSSDAREFRLDTSNTSQ